eukprot:GEMP01048816.1.p1 GENE.GEMP01048816.1~~GEMP01048816.1.p1  ORF type:complete len:264 (+),score=107.86 GEMP01048816.1:149-940(+)
MDPDVTAEPGDSLVGDSVVTDGLVSEFSSPNSMMCPPEIPTVSKIDGETNVIDRLLTENTIALADTAASNFVHAVEEKASMADGMKVLRRLELCAKAREESTKIMSFRCVERDSVKCQMTRERQEYLEMVSQSKKERADRWTSKTSRSPFNVDLVAEHQRVDEENRVRTQLDMQKARLAAKREREAHNAIFKRALHTTDELDLLRREKRVLLENEKKLKALRDLEKSNARSELVLHQRRQKHLEFVKRKAEHDDAAQTLVKTK